MITNYKIYHYGNTGDTRHRGATFDYKGRSYRVHRNGHISQEYRREGYYSRYWVSRTVKPDSKIGRDIRCALDAVIETNNCSE